MVLTVTATRSEVINSFEQIKNGQSVGFDKISYEIFNLNLCFATGLVPSVWIKAMIFSLTQKTKLKTKEFP